MLGTYLEPQIKPQRKKYWIELKKCKHENYDVHGLYCVSTGWRFFLVCINGERIMKSNIYRNKAQCRNMAKKVCRLIESEVREL